MDGRDGYRCIIQVLSINVSSLNPEAVVESSGFLGTLIVVSLDSERTLKFTGLSDYCYVLILDPV